jgi:hypothetical protein
MAISILIEIKKQHQYEAKMSSIISQIEIYRMAIIYKAVLTRSPYVRDMRREAKLAVWYRCNQAAARRKKLLAACSERLV